MITFTYHNSQLGSYCERAVANIRCGMNLGIRSVQPPALQQAVSLVTPQPDVRLRAPSAYHFYRWTQFLQLWHLGRNSK